MSALTTVYRCYDAEGELLYVGCTGKLRARLWQHAKGKPWWADVIAVDLEDYADRADALEAEAAAIGAEAPLHNVTHNTCRRDDLMNTDLATWVADSRAAQGLPPTVEDTSILAKLAAVLAAAERRS